MLGGSYRCREIGEDGDPKLTRGEGINRGDGAMAEEESKLAAFKPKVGAPSVSSFARAGGVQHRDQLIRE